MRLIGISVNLARNEYEYNKYVNEANKKAKPWSSKSSKAPFIVVTFTPGNGESDLSKVQLSLTPDANFTSITAASKGEYAVDSDNKKLNVDLTKLDSMQLVLQVKNDCAYEKSPLDLVAKAVVTSNGANYSASYLKPDVSNKNAILGIVDRELIQGSACNSTLAQIIYELLAADNATQETAETL